ncbi:hypothetical protein RHAB21_00818 [Pseudorhizobium halotolerans]|uniref:Lecithin:cholesterol acyltransferase n=1 Tax=Pseudorhizobium halotolerans TaxID=1233081 RepID=A0ABN7JZW6_9HYPH|nr:hypothetical protein [Pseudorhizobium halotolerans]CAD7055904.1 hypothetical protein RHAB21_00818 [Pseudorhizobium halotolerans]
MRLFHSLIYTLTLAAALCANSTGAKAISYLKGYSGVTVVFIPGIYGSILKDDDGNVFWGENGIGDKGLSVQRFPELKASLFQDVRFEVGIVGGTVRGYSGIRQNLQQLGQNILVFPYDWRLSNKTSAAKLNDFLCERFPDIRKSERLVFVAHSMGGLVLRHWIKDHMGKRQTRCEGIGIDSINSFNFAGTPHAGSLEPIKTLLNGETALDRNPIYSWLFTARMASDALTFESAYELLPAASIAGPDCAGIDENAAMYVSKDVGTGQDVPVFLDTIESWHALQIPVELPSEISRAEALALVEKRIAAASEIVCELIEYRFPPPVSERMHFIVGELKDPRTKDFASQTANAVKLIVRPSKPIKLEVVLGKGDGTVPYWSGEPRGMNLIGHKKYPHSTDRQHAELLDDSAILAHLQRVLEEAAYEVALMGDRPIDTDIQSTEQWFEATKAATALPLETISPEGYTALVSYLSKKAVSVGVSGVDIYRNAKSYEASDAARYQAVAYATASRVGTGLNDISEAWANQNAANALFKLGNEQLAVATALRAGEMAAQLADQPNATSSAGYSAELNKIESKWRSIVLHSTPIYEDHDLRSLVAESPKFDPGIFSNEMVVPYTTLPRI